jgi:hypothetical protein
VIGQITSKGEGEKEMTTVTQNIVVCPHCERAFEHNKVNGVALVQLASDIESLKRVAIRLMLNEVDRLDRDGELTAATIRKIILDKVNDLIRNIHTNIGFGVDSE